MTIKIKNKKYELQANDYFFWNGSCWQFCGGNGRVIYSKGFDSYRALRAPKSALKAMNLNILKFRRRIVSENEIYYIYRGENDVKTVSE